jgi:hypothetical protein
VRVYGEGPGCPEMGLGSFGKSGMQEAAREDLIDAETRRRGGFWLVMGGLRRFAEWPETGLGSFGMPGMEGWGRWMAGGDMRAKSAREEGRCLSEDMLILTYYAGKRELE